MGISADLDDLDETATLNKEKPILIIVGDNVESKSTTAQENDRKRYRSAIGLFIVIDVLLIGLIIFTALFMSSDKNVLLYRYSNICVPCADLKLHPDDDIEGVTRVGENKDTCCMKETEQPSALIGYFVDHWLKTKLSTDDRPFTRYECKDGHGEPTVRPNIKLVGTKVKQSVDHHKLKWDGESDASIVLHDSSITHHKEHGVIEIKIAGLYHVYSQVVLEYDMSSHNPYSGPAIYQHTVIQHKAGSIYGGSHERENAIMKTSNSHCSSRSNKQQITSYLGSAFQLSEGDRLFVKVHNVTEVIPIPHMNYFGAHML